MLIILPVAGALLTHTAFALTIGDRGTPQVVLPNHDSPPTAPPDILEDVDISEGWADPRINGGRFLDVRGTRCTCDSNSDLILRSSQHRSSASLST